MDDVKDLVKRFLNVNGVYYIEGFNLLTNENKTHIINIGVGIMNTYWGLTDEKPCGFVENFLNNDLEAVLCSTDNLKLKCLKFFLALKNNLVLPE
jgi:hypothetical protein